jgi:hypothetical protein
VTSAELKDQPSTRINACPVISNIERDDAMELFFYGG